VTPDETVWLLAALLILALAGVFSIGYYCGREDSTDPRAWDGSSRTRHPYGVRPVGDFGLWELEASERVAASRLAATEAMTLLRDRRPGDIGYQDTSTLSAIPDANADERADQERTEQ
jgi:hypothetical protein